MNQPVVVTVRHCRALGLCLTDGVRPFCNRHGIDFRAFVKDGVSEEVLLATGDAMAISVVQRVRKMEQSNVK